MDNNYMYNIIRLIREKLPWLVNILNSTIIYPFRRLKTEYFYKKNPNQIYSFYFEGKKVSFHLPFRNDLIQQTIISKNTFFEVSELKIIRKYVPRHSLFVDIGANIGNHLVFFGLCSDPKKIIGFEPNPDIFPLLRENVILNNLESRTELHKIAIGSEKSKGSLVGSTNITDTFYTDKSVSVNQTGDIDILPLDDIIKEKIDFIKIDVEGMELEVIKGSLKRISSEKPVIFIESDKIEKVMELLKPYNYGIELSLAHYNYLLIAKE